MEQQLQQFIQQYPVEILALLEMVMQMNEEQLQQFFQALQQLAGQGQGGGQSAQQQQGEVSAQAEQEMSNRNLFGA
jgi:hypothetical protein